jgi:hypothetical protein
VVAVGVVLIILIIMIARGFQTVPPSTIAKDWFEAMYQRQMGKAQSLVTPRLQEDLAKRNSSLMAVADDYYSKVNTDGAKYKVGKLTFDVPDSPKTASVSIPLDYPDGRTGSVDIEMVKVGRQWRVNRILSGI